MKVELVTSTPNAEAVIEDAARTCYQSESKDAVVGNLIKKLIKICHHSVLEHASATFRINEVSRAFSHQLVRQRLASFSQQSQRYVNEKQFDFVVPPEIKHMDEKKGDDVFSFVSDFENDMIDIQKMYDKWKARGLKNEDARFVLPNACHTEIVISANFREFRHIFELRCDKHAQWEIRFATMKMLVALYEISPNVFEDLYDKFIVESESSKWFKDMEKYLG